MSPVDTETVLISANIFYVATEFYYRLFTPRWIQPLANLSYGAYIVHFILVMYNTGQAKTARTLSPFIAVSIKKLM